ncbi:MAG: hypothetical protein FD130_36 [Halothiobacillaceae bacterium]|nr:MAG: hypothetical protein FD130_36 [Halothiobacillaceae bacterium]
MINGTLNASSVVLVGTGGGLYSSSGQQNYGVSLSGTVYNATVTGIGGIGMGGQHHGVFVSGLTANSDLTFINSVGGNGGTSNYGVNVSGNLTMVNGTLQFSNITGGGVLTSNYGVAIAGVVTAPMVIGADIFGGPGSGNDYGLYLSGSLVANEVLMSAGSIGIGSSEVGIYLVGTINADIATLTGLGGGLYSSAGVGNYGIYLNGATLTVPNGILLTGTGGEGSGGFHHGVSIETTSSTVTSSSFRFQNCMGGSGGNSNYGVNAAANLSMASGTLYFNDVSGGSNGTTNYGLYISATVSAPAIIGTDLFDAPDNERRLYG